MHNFEQWKMLRQQKKRPLIQSAHPKKLSFLAKGLAEALAKGIRPVWQGLLVFIFLIAILRAPALGQDLYRIPLATYPVESVTSDSAALINAFQRDQEPAWLEGYMQKLAKAKSRNRFLKNRLLFKKVDEPTYLVVLWQTRDGVGDVLEIYRADFNQPGFINFQFTQDFKADNLVLVAPTGADALGDGIATLYLQFENKQGQSWTDKFGLRVIRLIGGGKEILTTAAAQNLFPTNAGIYRDIHTLIAYQALTEPPLRLTAKQSGVFHIPVTLRWQGDSYVKSCRATVSFFKTYIARLTQEDTDQQIHQKINTIFLQALVLAQAGLFDAAFEEFDLAWQKFSRQIRDNVEDFSYADTLIAGKYMIDRLKAFSQRQSACPIY